MPPSPNPQLSDASPRASAGHRVAIARQAIVDERRAVFGYEFTERPRAAANDDAVLFDTLSDVGAETLAGRKSVFIHCTFEHMADGHLELLDAAKVVLEVPTLSQYSEEGVTIRRSMLERARKDGFRLAFDTSVLQPAYASWLPLASFIKLDLRTTPAEALAPLVLAARRQSKAQLIAEHVETQAHYELLTTLNVKLFQGSWFAQPTAIVDKAVRTSQATVVQLLNLVQNDADIGDIEELLKKDPALSFKLLRLINSSGFGLRVEVTSFRHAVMIMGLTKLFRWATLLMTTSLPGGAAPAAGTTAVVRGRLMELLAAELMSKEDCDNAFVVGVFSLLDTLLGVPLARALESIQLPEGVTAALLNSSGNFAPFLALTKACETGDEAAFAKAAEELQLSNHQVNWAHLQALMWADRLEESI